MLLYSFNQRAGEARVVRRAASVALDASTPLTLRIEQRETRLCGLLNAVQLRPRHLHEGNVAVLHEALEQCT